MIEISQKPISNVLKSILDEKKARNPRFSMRAFAKKVGLNSGGLSLIISGKRRISRKQAEKIASRIPIPSNLIDSYIEPFEIQDKIDDLPEDPYSEFRHNDFSGDSLWIVFAVLALLRVKTITVTSSLLCSKLGIDIDLANKVLISMKYKGLIKGSEEDGFRRIQAPLRTSDNISDKIIREAHIKNCEIAKLAIQNVDVNKRDFTSTTMAVNLSKLDEAKSIIRNFQKEISVLLEHNADEEIYQLNVQLFPLATMYGNSC